MVVRAIFNIAHQTAVCRARLATKWLCCFAWLCCWFLSDVPSRKYQYCGITFQCACEHFSSLHT